MDEITYTCAGINHMAWYLDYKWKGEDAYPLIRKAITEREEVYNEEIVRNEMFLALDYYVTESSGHNSEYNWWFRKRPDLIEKYCTHGTGWNPGEYAYIVKGREERTRTWREETERWLADDTPIELERGHEYAAYIMNALEGGEPFEFNGNMANKGLITQSAAGRVRGGARVGQPQGAGVCGGGRAAAASRHADELDFADRGDGGGGDVERRSAPHLSGDCP